MRKDPKPIIKDQYTAAQVYFASVIVLVLLEALIYLPPYINKLFKRRPFTPSSPARHSRPRLFLHRLLGAPSLLPSITAHRLPSLFRFVAFAALNVLFGYNRLRFTTDYKLYGWLTIANGGACLLLSPRGFLNPFTTIFRIPTTVVLFYHRLLGFATIVHATIHWATTAAHYVRTHQLDVTLTSTFTQWGLAAWACLVIIALTAVVSAVRRRAYEVFFYAHFLFIIFVVGSCLHAKHSPEFLLPGTSLWALDRLVRFAITFRRVVPVSVVHYPLRSGGAVTKFRLDGVKVTRPNQMAWVRLPGVSLVNWHPFTVASAPGDRYATIAIRGLGGFTKKVQDVALESSSASSSSSSREKDGSQRGLRICVDGPYGHGGTLWEQYSVVALVAGGIGITPSISIASHMVRWAASADRSTLRGNGWHVHLLWVVRDVHHARWFEEELREIARLAAETNAPVTLDVDIFVSGGGPSQAGRTVMGGEEERSVGGESNDYVYRGPGAVYRGRPDLDAWMGSIATRRRDQDVATSLCGPRKLIDGARKAALRASSKTGLFHVEEEVFEF